MDRDGGGLESQHDSGARERQGIANYKLTLRGGL
jgi:hypothetical protein